MLCFRLYVIVIVLTRPAQTDSRLVRKLPHAQHRNGAKITRKSLPDGDREWTGLVYTSHVGISARQLAPESVARRQMQQSSTVLNFRASRQRTPAILPIMYRCHELSLQRIELALTSVSSILGNQLVASESQRASDHGQRAVVTPRVKLSLSFLSPFSIYLINFIHIDS